MICTHDILFFILLLLFIFAACSRTTHLTPVLEHVDTLIESNADSAYFVLEEAHPLLDDATEAERMKYLLRLTDAKNKLDMEMPTDSAFFEVVDYYDHHGSANEQMKAHYLLGRVYFYMNDAPVALQSFYDAVEKADTLSKDCDYLTLMCIWGQIAMVLNDQYMPKEELEAWQNYRKYAEIIGDTYELRKQYDDMNCVDNEDAFYNSEVNRRIQKILEYKLDSPKYLTDEEKTMLLVTVKNCMPCFYMYLHGQHTPLTEQETLTCILVRLRFSVNDISSLLKTSAQTITNAKGKSNIDCIKTVH